MFTPEARDAIRERVIEIARADSRTTAGARIGSTAGGSEDGWSDIDITFGIAEGNAPKDVLDDWMAQIDREYNVVHYWDLPFRTSIYRVLLLESGMEIDLSVTPQPDFGARGSRFQVIFGEYKQLEESPGPDARYIIGLAWHNVRHAAACISRNKLWQAEYWINSLRDQVFLLMEMRFDLRTAYRHGVHQLPDELTAPMEKTLVRSLNQQELHRALTECATCFTTEIAAWDAPLAATIAPVLNKFIAQQVT